jgi:PAS domain S-box-containing protein
MKKRLLELIDFEKVNVLLEGFNQSTGFVTAIVDLDGTILSQSGWRRICTDFHRKNNTTLQNCIVSDTVLAVKMRNGEKYHSYKCLNGLVDVAVPIIVKGEHIANLFTGQFFFEKPDWAFFENHAHLYGFDKDEYFSVVNEVPVISEDKVNVIMDFLLNMTRLISDMTFQKLELLELNEALRMSEEQYRLVLENSMDAIIITTHEGKVVSANQAACKMFKHTESEICNLMWNDLVDINDERIIELENTRKISGRATGEIVMCRKNSTKFPAEISTSVFQDQQGTLRTEMIIRDITERKNIEKQLIEAKEKAEESDRLKTAFLQNMSHEIRTPMNAIMGFSELLNEQYNNKQKLNQFSNIINQRCNDLLDVINDILDIAKIESGQLQVNTEECHLKELFAELSVLFEGYQNRLGKQHIMLNWDNLNNSSDTVIYTDMVKLKQILINLISNALKFTNEGMVDVGCKILDNNSYLFYVADTGMGIPADKHHTIFERFSQLNLNSKRNIGGTGLGLSIVKGLVNLLEGEINLQSEPGKGSTFSFFIKGRDAGALTLKASLNGNMVKNFNLHKTILIVEDDFYNFEYLKEVLSGRGFCILQSETGENAIETVLQNDIDLVLMDIRLPGIDGYEATRQIRKHKPEMKIIAQTAYASVDEKQKAFDAGCSDYLSKPTKQESLLTMVQRHLS